MSSFVFSSSCFLRFSKMIFLKIQNAIKAGRYLPLARFYLALAGSIAWRFPNNALSQNVLEARLYIEYSLENYPRAEDILIDFCRRANPPTSAVVKYIARVLYKGHSRKLPELLNCKTLSPGNIALLQSASSRSAGELTEALSLLEANDFSPEEPKHAAQAGRSIPHQLQVSDAMAADGLAFFDAESDYIDFKFLITIAATAENAEREDLFARAISRMLQDLERAISNPSLSLQHMDDIVAAMTTMFDLEGAERFLNQPFIAATAKAKNLLAELKRVRDDAADYLHVLNQARDHLVARARGTARLGPGPVLILSAAAFRSNKIDYSGFRSDLRYMFGQIVRCLEQNNIAYGVASRIKTHGCVQLKQPYFSYHTIADTDYGLHFKETDRPSLLSFDERGYAGWSHFSQQSADEIAALCFASDEETNAFFESEKRRVIGGNISKYGQPSLRTAERLPERYIFVATQILDDAVSQLAYMSPFDMLDQVISTAQMAGVSVVVKRHPMCASPEMSSYLNKIKKMPAVTIATGSIHTLIARAEAVCVINSGVGAEALLHEKPVYVFGRADYMAACFVCSAPGDFSRTFKTGASQLTPELLRKFWHVYRNVYAIDVLDSASAARKIDQKIKAHLSFLSDQRAD